jgi:hypothetical protein
VAGHFFHRVVDVVQRGVRVDEQELHAAARVLLGQGNDAVFVEPGVGAVVAGKHHHHGPFAGKVGEGDCLVVEGVHQRKVFDPALPRLGSLRVRPEPPEQQCKKYG